MLIDEGATWAVTFAGATRRLRDSKGLRDLVILLGRPQQEVHCLELAGGADVGGDVGPALDEHARRAYQQRIQELQEDIDDARAANDPARAERAEGDSTRSSSSSARRSACPGVPGPEAQQPSGHGQQ